MDSPKLTDAARPNLPGRRKAARGPRSEELAGSLRQNDNPHEARRRSTRAKTCSYGMSLTRPSFTARKRA